MRHPCEDDRRFAHDKKVDCRGGVRHRYEKSIKQRKKMDGQTYEVRNKLPISYSTTPRT